MYKRQVYKCKLIPREAVVYMEEGTYSSTAMVIRDKCILVDRELQEHTPDIRELIHYCLLYTSKLPLDTSYAAIADKGDFYSIENDHLAKATEVLERI